MSKILITSDIHFDSYPNRTPTKDYRLNQSYIIVDNLLDIAKTEGADYIFILGDILEKENRESTIHSVVKNCLNKLMTGFKCGYYILGNHDMKATSSQNSEKDKINSYIPLYCPDSLIYADRKIIEIDGITFGFRNYSSSPKLDLKFISESGRSYVDVLCGHSAQSYTDEEVPYQIQEYDQSKVSLYCFFGHIHQSVSKGKNVSIGVPQRAKISDDNPKVVIFDTITKQWKHVDADPHKKLMDFKETYESETDYFDSSSNTYYISRKKPTENKELLKAISDTNYDKIFDVEIKSRNLSDVFTEIKDSTPVESLERLDLDFSLTHIDIQNWRTIKSLSLNFRTGDQYLVYGHNGSGKSSLYSAICYGLSGKCSGNLKDNIRFGEKEFQITINLDYKNSSYVIKRGSSILELWKDGSLLELGNKTQTKDGILKELPFIEAMDLLYYNDTNQRILGNSSSSDTVKLQILYKILGLNEIDAYNNVASEKQKALSKEFTRIHELFIIKESAISDKKSKLDLFNFGNINIEDRLKQLNEKLSEYQDLYRQKQEYDRYLESIQNVLSEISGTESLIVSLKQNLSNFEDINKLNSDSVFYKEKLSEYNNELQNLLRSQSEYSRLSGSREFIIQEGKRLKAELESLEDEIKRPVFCTNYNIRCTLITEDVKKEKLSSKKKELEQKRKEKLDEYYSVNESLKNLNFDSNKIKEISDLISENQKNLTLVENKISEYSRLNNQIKEKEKYLLSLKNKSSLNEMNKPPQLPDNILVLISDISSEISSLENYRNLKEEYNKYFSEYSIIKEEHEKLKTKIEKYGEFISLTKPSGIIYTKIFEIIMASFSDNKIKYEVNVTTRGTNRYINISSYLKRSTGNVSYSGASQGERCMMDIHFLSNLKVKLGILILDEFLGNLDQENHDDALTKMQTLKTNLLFVTSHKENLIPFPSRIEVTNINQNESNYLIC